MTHSLVPKDKPKMDSAQLDKALQKIVSTGTGSRLQKRLPQEELTALGILLERTARRYPSQDLTDALPEYLADLEQLALKHSVQKVEDAVTALRTDPDQHFFPTPDEIAHKIRQQWLRSLPSHIYARQ